LRGSLAWRRTRWWLMESTIWIWRHWKLYIKLGFKTILKEGHGKIKSVKIGNNNPMNLSKFTIQKALIWISLFRAFSAEFKHVPGEFNPGYASYKSLFYRLQFNILKLKIQIQQMKWSLSKLREYLNFKHNEHCKTREYRSLRNKYECQ